MARLVLTRTGPDCVLQYWQCYINSGFTDEDVGCYHC